MSDKSYVTMEQHICPICGKKHDTNAILLDRQLRRRFDRHTVTGYSECGECKAMIDQGYIALVEITNTPAGGQDRIKNENANRSGKMAWLKRDAAVSIFNVPIPANLNMVFIEPGVLEKLQEKTGHDGVS